MSVQENDNKIAPIARPIRTSEKDKSLGRFSRAVGRYFVPRFLASLIIYFRDHALVSISSTVQVTPLVRLGRGTVVKPYSYIQTSGGRVVFGRNCAIGSFNHITANQVDVIAGDEVKIGPHVTIVGTTRLYRRKDQSISEQGYADKGIRIGNDVLIGAGSVLVDGCEIGDGAVIGVGSIVTGKVPPYAVVFGSPAKVIFWRT